MKKTDLIKDLKKEFNLTEEEARLFVNRFFEELLSLVIEGGRLELRGFGVFRLRRLSGRFIKNPKTGVEVYVGERYRIGFKPSVVFTKNEKS